MPDYKLVKQEIEVPKNTGVEGFVHTLRQILILPRIQGIRVDAKGKVSYERYISDGEESVIGVDFEGLQPWHVIRNADVEEMHPHSTNPVFVVKEMFDRVEEQNLNPTAFVTGANSVLKSWFAAASHNHRTTDYRALFGLPIHRDRNMPDTVLVLCSSYLKSAALIDTTKSFKIEMNMVEAPETKVEVL